MKTLITGVLVCFILGVGLYILTCLTSGQSERQMDEPTVVQLGQVTEKQREYSKEYKKLYSDFKGRKLSEVSARAKVKGSKGEVGVFIGIPTFPKFGPERTATEFVADLSCQAEVVVRGLPQRKTAYPTEDETFVYTEYDFLVKEVLRNNASPIDINDTVQITRPGGLIKLGDQVIRVEDGSYKPLQIGNEVV